ncbi:MAG: molybdopterin-dependent oxidoreductase [Gammaproteobacteria bacterium]|nr:molybdopterin-dependent oxidoreductase [Gammaproteobacteria bacterium]
MPDRQSRVTSSHWGAFRVLTENGRITSVEPFEADNDPSGIPNSLPAAVHHATRVARPSIRRGWLEGKNRARELRGNDEFIELPWDEALDITATELVRVRNEHGNQAIFGGSYGWASAGRFHHALGQVHRFLNCIGGYVSSLASYSTAGAQAIMPHVLGMHFLKLGWGAQNAWPMIAENTETLVMFGGINPKNSQVSMGGVTRHETSGWLRKFADQGMRLVNVSPQKTDAYEGSQWLPIVPGTDTAMMLGLAYTLETEGLVDRDFLERCTTGYERFKAYLLGETDGQAKTVDWAAEICEIDAKTIREIALTMARTRTLITVAWSLQRAQHGEQPYWMATTLAAMLGQIGLAGGGVGYGYGAIGGIGVAVRRLGGMTLPQGTNPISDFIPVARIADMLLNPGADYEFNGQHRQYADIRLVYWCGGNPFHHHQDINRFNRAWRQPETIIVHEPWWTATAKRADIVLPATTPYEREDIGLAQGDSFLFHMDRLIPPVGEARNDYDIFAGLAQRMDAGEAFTEGRDSSQWLHHLYHQFRQKAIADGIEVPEFEQLCAQNWVELPIAGSQYTEVPFAAFRENPEADPLGTPSGLIEIFSETIDSFGYDDCPGHPTWLVPEEWLGADLAEQFPLHLVSPQPGDKLHSQMECAISDIPGARPTAIEINIKDARERGINDGDLVRVFNDRGACQARAHVSAHIRPSVVALPTGAWYDPANDGTDTQGNPNLLTRDRGTSRLGQGCSAHTALVEIALWSSKD